jgi:hypothetical protein
VGAAQGLQLRRVRPTRPTPNYPSLQFASIKVKLVTSFWRSEFLGRSRGTLHRLVATERCPERGYLRDWEKVQCLVFLIVIYEPSAGRRCSRMNAFFIARATKVRVPLINARMNERCLHASGSYNIFCTNIKLNIFVLIH